MKNEIQFFNDIRYRIKEIRKHLKMTQRVFGESGGIDRRYIAKVECGSQRPSFNFLRCLSIKHNISLNWLIFGIGPRFMIPDMSQKWASKDMSLTEAADE